MEEERSTDQPEMQEAATEAVEERSMAALMLTEQPEVQGTGGRGAGLGGCVSCPSPLAELSPLVHRVGFTWIGVQ